MEVEKLETGVSERQNLIRPNARDRVIIKIQRKQAERAEGEIKEKTRRKERKLKRKRDELAKHTSKFARTFLDLCSRYFSLKRGEICNFDKEELLELEKLVAGRALRSSALPRLGMYTSFFAVVGLIHWLIRVDEYFGTDNTDTRFDPRPGIAWTYRYTRGKLMKAHGNDWFPVEEVKAWCLKKS